MAKQIQVKKQTKKTTAESADALTTNKGLAKLWFTES